MLVFAQIDRETKRIIQFVGGNGQDAIAAHMAEQGDCWFIQSEDFGDPKDFELNAAGFISRVQHVEDLAALKAAKWGLIRAARDAACSAPVTLNGRVYQADDVSRARISEWAGRAARADGDWSIDWTLLDNTEVTLTAAELLALDAAIAARSKATFATARTLRATIDAAGSSDQLDLVVWTAEHA